MPNSNSRTHQHKILVVDDEPAIHKLIEIHFSRRNYKVIKCLDSEKAGRLCREGHSACVNARE